MWDENYAKYLSINGRKYGQRGKLNQARVVDFGVLWTEKTTHGHVNEIRGTFFGVFVLIMRLLNDII